MPEMTHYYAMKNEYQSITRDLQNIQVSTVQWDVKDGPRFDIGFTDADGAHKPCPVILHASSFGSIERTLCTLFENIAVDQDAGKPPMFPVWLSPTQCRVIPVKDEFHGYADEIADQLNAGKVRADVDERAESVGRKIRDSGVEWIPYTLVVGQKELDRDDGKLPVRVRRHPDHDDQTETVDMSLAELIGHVHETTGDVPWLPLPLPRQLSRRPIFFG
jgi:threonyl-tRNA synthetase